MKNVIFARSFVLCRNLEPACCPAMLAVLMLLSVAAPTAAQLRVEDRLKIGDIAIRYDSNRWMPASDDTNTKIQLKCRELHCGIDVGIEVEEKSNVCRAETVNELLLQRLQQTKNGRFSPYDPQRNKAQQFGKMTMHMASAYNGCHVRTEFAYVCGEYRGKTYSIWLSPQRCGVGSEELMARLLSGISAP